MTETIGTFVQRKARRVCPGRVCGGNGLPDCKIGDYVSRFQQLFRAPEHISDDPLGGSPYRLAAISWLLLLP